MFMLNSAGTRDSNAVSTNQLIRGKFDNRNGFTLIPAECARLAGCLSAARRFLVSYDATFLHRNSVIETTNTKRYEYMSNFRHGMYPIRTGADNYESRDLAHKTIVVISAIETMHAHTLIGISCVRSVF